MSKDARFVIKRLDLFGIEISRTIENGVFDLELCCLWFKRNHIVGVIDLCLKGKNTAAKLMKAQDQGWGYFARPVQDMLSTRMTAQFPRGTPYNTDTPVLPWSAEAYYLVTQSLLTHDINRAESGMLVFDVPLLGGKADVVSAMTICRDRNARSIPYLHGIMTRNAAQRTARLQERKESEVGVWKPTDEVIEDSSDHGDDWEFRRMGIQSVKHLGQNPRRRRGS